MYPHERSLVEKLKDKPFALLGINSDPRDTAKQAVEEENLSWRSWWDGGNTAGPIASKWNVRGWPTIYILDEEGVIRYKGVRGELLGKAVVTLLAEMGEEVESDEAGDSGS